MTTVEQRIEKAAREFARGAEARDDAFDEEQRAGTCLLEEIAEGVGPALGKLSSAIVSGERGFAILSTSRRDLFTPRSATSYENLESARERSMHAHRGILLATRGGHRSSRPVLDEQDTPARLLPSHALYLLSDRRYAFFEGAGSFSDDDGAYAWTSTLVPASAREVASARWRIGLVAQRLAEELEAQREGVAEATRDSLRRGRVMRAIATLLGSS